MDGEDDLRVTEEEIKEVNICSDGDEEENLLEELPEKDELETQKNVSVVRNDSGLETSDSMDAVKDDKEPPPLIPMAKMISLCPENANDVPKNVTVTQSACKLPELQALVPTPCDSPEKSVNSSRRSSGSISFIDSLLDKIGRRATLDGSGSDVSPNKLEPPKSVTEDDDDLLEEMEAPVAFEKSNNPNMLPTPIVKNPQNASIFVNSNEEFEMTLAKKQVTGEKSKSFFDKSKMSSKSQPPKMNAPRFPSNIPKPRTLAEKRMLINTNMDFLMIEQESRIFKQIERKKKGEALNYNLIETMMNEDIPINSGAWRALQWLRTQEGNYIQQHVNIDGVNYKLSGSRGNHRNKYLPPQSNMPYPKIKKIAVRSVRCCPGGKIKKREIDQFVTVESIKKFVLEESLEPYKRLESKNIHNQLSSIKPRPLGKKIEYINKNRKLLKANEDCMFLGEFSKFEMPDIQLEVTVQNKVPLNAVAKQYLNELIPFRDLNENWINFALSPVKSEEANEEENKVFEFKVPYQENKRHILVREVIKSKHDTEQLRIYESTDDDVDEMEWTFSASADKNDPLEMEVVDVIKDLTNSVFINLNDDLFTKDDPDDRAIPMSIVKPKDAIEELNTSKKDNPMSDKSKKILSELRRLNANVVKSDVTEVLDEEVIRRHATAHLGREERELRATVLVTDSDTVLLGNKEKESRRTKRLPKRFNDYEHPNANPEGQKDTEAHQAKKAKQNVPQVHEEKVKPSAQEKVTSDDLKAIREEVQRWLHVTVDINRMEVLSCVQHWCLIHSTYKCACKSVGLTSTPEYRAYKKYSAPNTANNSLNSSRCNSIEKEDLTREKSAEPDEEHPPRRVLPVEIRANRSKEIDKSKIAESENKPSTFEMPQMEIVNLGELINCSIGPIYINVYDTKENRLKPIFRSILNNKVALAYIDGFAYFIDTTRVDVKRLKFDKMRPVLEHAIFIISPKITPHNSNSSVICEDFVQLLFQQDSDVIKDITDKKELKVIADLIESILKNARNKLEMQLQVEPNELVKSQLNMIRRDRLCSESTVSSSAHTSPLHFQGKELEKAPSPDSALMKEFNKIFSIRMQRLCAMIKSNVLGLHPTEAYINKFYIYRWDLLLQGFESGAIHIWQAKMTGESGDNYVMLAITDNNQPPAIENVAKENVTNIRKLSLAQDNLCELTRLILLRAESAKTKYMTLLLFGCQGFFRVCGILNSKESFVDGFFAKPTRVTHPRLTAKIQKIYNVWHGLKKAKERALNGKKPEDAEIVVVENKPEESESSESDDDVEIVEPSPKKQRVEIQEPTRNKNRDIRELSFNKNKVVIKEPTLKPAEIQTPPIPPIAKPQVEKVNQPKEVGIPSTSVITADNKWFLFNIAEDFSDIFIKQWNRYLSHEIIMKGIVKAKERQKAVQLVGMGSVKNTWPRIYALPKAPLKFKDKDKMTGNFLIFGPYLRTSNSNLLLMQSDGDRVYLRDDYEKIHNIKHKVRTRCIWIYANKLNCITESVGEKMYFAWHEQKKKQPENNLKIASIIGGFTDKCIQNGSV